MKAVHLTSVLENESLKKDSTEEYCPFVMDEVYRIKDSDSLHSIIQVRDNKISREDVMDGFFWDYIGIVRQNRERLYLFHAGGIDIFARYYVDKPIDYI